MDNKDKLKILLSRRSVRTYLPESLEKKIKDGLTAEIMTTNSFVPGLRFEIFFNNSDPFKGFFKSYGTFKNPNNYIAVIVDEGFDNIWEKAGYFAEKFVIKCTELGLGTCFVGGTYDPSSVNVLLHAGEKILFVVLFGIPSNMVRIKEKLLVDFVHRKKMDASQFFEPSDDFNEYCQLIPELMLGVEAVACAPSALNKRPVRIFVNQNSDSNEVCAKVDDKNKKNLIDLGIAKYNYNFVTGTECQWGNEKPLTGGEDEI